MESGREGSEKRQHRRGMTRMARRADVKSCSHGSSERARGREGEEKRKSESGRREAEGGRGEREGEIEGKRAERGLFLERHLFSCLPTEPPHCLS